MREQDLVEQVRALLTALGAWHMRNVGLVEAQRGLPDILACYQGRLIAIKCKGRHSRLRPAQEAQLAALERAGALCIVARCLEDVLQALEREFPQLRGRVQLVGRAHRERGP